MKARRAIESCLARSATRQAAAGGADDPSLRCLGSAPALVCNHAPHFPAECCRHSLVGSPALGLQRVRGATDGAVPWLKIRADRSWGAVVALAAAMSVLAAVAARVRGYSGFPVWRGYGRTATACFGAGTAIRASVPILRAPNATINVNPSVSGGGQYVAYCVRLCDGRYFPLQRSIVEQSTQVCQACARRPRPRSCSALKSRTRTARSTGLPYARLPNAFAYREKDRAGLHLQRARSPSAWQP